MRLNLVSLIFAICVLALVQASPPSCTTDPKLTAAASSAYHIDGGGWRLVRRVAPSDNAWHPATDNLLGTASYGTATIDETADSTFSIPFSADASTEFLFATGDAQKWLIATGAQIGGAFTDDYYDDSDRAFQLTSDGEVFGHDDMDMTGQMSQNMGAKVYDFSDQSGFTIVTKIKWTAKQNYENFFALKHADTSFYVAINRFQTRSDLYVGFIDSNGVSCGSPYAGNPQTHGLYTPSNAWFLLKIKYEHASKTLCQYVDSVEKCHTCASNFVLPSTVTLENWLGGNLATNAAYSGEMAGFYAFNRPLTAEEQTRVADRIVVDAPDSGPSAKWFNRVDFIEDPWISINDGLSSPNLMLYGENSYPGAHMDLVTAHNGANVFVRTTYIYPAASFVFNPASTAEETFDGSRGDIISSQSVPVTTDSDGWTIIFKIRYDSSGVTWDAVFDLNSDATNLGNIYATISTTNTLRILVRNPGSSTTLCKLDSAAIFVSDVLHAVVITFSTQSEILSMKIGTNAEVTTSCAGFVSRTYTALSIGTARQWNNAEWNGKILGMYFFDSLVESNRAQELVSQIVEGGRDAFSCPLLCGDGFYKTTGAVVSVDDTIFNRANNDYVDLGPKTYNIYTNGGFTVVTKVKFTSTGAYETLFTTGSAYQSNEKSIGILRDASANELKFVMKFHGTWCRQFDVPISNNNWLTIIWKYVSSTKTQIISIDGNEYSVTCTWPDDTPLDVSNPINVLGKPLFSGDAMLNADVAGFYFFDKLLSDTDIASVQDGIAVGDTDTLPLLECAACTVEACGCPANTYLDAEQCTSCPSNSNSPSGSTLLSDCACDANYEQDWGVVTDEYVEEKTGVKGWTLAKHLTADETKWYTADYMQQTSPPDWTEILLTRALGTANEKWVRFSRSTWDFFSANDEVRPGQTNSYDPLMIEVIDMYPAEESKTVKVFPRNSVQTMAGAPYIFMPPISPSNWPSSHAERRASMIYAQHTDYLYNRNKYWPDRKTGVVDGSLNTISEDFKVFLRYSEFTCVFNCPSNTYISAGPVLAFNPSAGAETFDRSIPTEVDLGPVQWNVLDHGGVTLVAKIKFSSSPSRYERVFAATDSATAGNALFQIMRRDEEEKMFFIFNDGDTNCVSPDIAITNEQWISMKFWFNSATNNMEVQLDDGDIYYTDCSAVSGFFAQDRLQNVNIFGKHGGSSPHFEGAIAGFYGFNSYLSTEAIGSVLNSIVIGDVDSAMPGICLDCPTDGSFVEACGCPADFFKSNGAVVSFNPEPAMETFGDNIARETSNAYSNLGPRTFKIAENGGFTVVFKANIGSSISKYESIFTFADGDAGSNVKTNAIHCQGSYQTSNAYFTCKMYDANVVQCKIDGHSNTMKANTDHSVIFRYDSASNALYLKTDSSVKTQSCTSNLQHSRTVANTLLGRTWSAGSAQLNGKIYGLYAFDRKLSDAEAESILGKIQVGALDMELEPVCTPCPTDGSFIEECSSGISCPPGSTLPPGSSTLNDCTCDSRLHSALGPIYDGRPPVSAWSYSGLSSDASCSNPIDFGVHDGVDTGVQGTACFAAVDADNYLQLDMSTEIIVTGVHTMGRASDAQYVTLYQVQVSKDGATWTNAPCAEVDASGFCVGNVDAGSVKQNDLASKVVARYVKLIVKGYSGGESLRMSVLAQTCVSCPNVAWQHYVPVVV